MKYFVAICLAFFACHCASATPCLGNALSGLGNLLGGVGQITGSLTKITGALNIGGIKGNRAFQVNQRVQEVVGSNETSEENDGEVDAVDSELEEVFKLIIETTESVENTNEVVISVLTVSDDVYTTISVMENIDDKTLNDANAFCEQTAYLDAAVEKILQDVNGVVISVATIVDNQLLEECDVITLKWVVEAIVAVSGNTVNAVSSLLETTIEVVSKPNKKSDKNDIKPSFAGLASALSGIVGTLTQARGSVTSGVSGGISAVDLQATLRGVTKTISSVALTNITNVVEGLVGSVTGALGGLLKGITGTVSQTLSGTLNAVGGVLNSLDVGGVTKILSNVTLSLAQVLDVVVSVIGNISKVSKSLTGVLGSLTRLGNVGGNKFKILPCKV